MEGKPVVTIIDPDTLSYEHNRKALEAVNPIKDQKKGIIEGITCTYGSNQKS